MTDAIEATEAAPKLIIDPSISVAEHGLAIQRKAGPGLERFIGHLADLNGVSSTNSVNRIIELRQTDLLGHTAFANVSREAAEDRIKTEAPSTADDMDVEVEGIKFTPSQKGYLILVTFGRNDTQRLQGEHFRVHRGLGTLAPGVVIGQDFDTIGLFVGRMYPRHSASQSKRVHRVGRQFLPSRLTLSAADFLPLTKQQEVAERVE